MHIYVRDRSTRDSGRLLNYWARTLVVVACVAVTQNNVEAGSDSPRHLQNYGSLAEIVESPSEEPTSTILRSGDELVAIAVRTIEGPLPSGRSASVECQYREPPAPSLTWTECTLRWYHSDNRSLTDAIRLFDHEMEHVYIYLWWEQWMRRLPEWADVDYRRDILGRAHRQAREESVHFDEVTRHGARPWRAAVCARGRMTPEACLSRAGG